MTNSSAPAAASPQARRVPNRTMTQAKWDEAMRLFCEEGWSDANIALHFDLSNTTVARYRFNHGVWRGEHPAPRAAPRPVARPAAKVEAAAGEGETSPETGEAPRRARPPRMPDFILPESDEPRAFAEALLAYGKALAQAGYINPSVAATRQARSFLLAMKMQAELDPALGPGFGESDRVEGEAPVLREAQTPPERSLTGTDWRTWLFLGGRGAGKTLAGAAWLARQAVPGARLALVGPTYADVREVMIEGPSGLRGAAAAFSPEAVRPRYEPSRRRLIWPNGAVAQVFTAEEPDGLRGPQFSAAWGDELCAWPDVGQVLAMLRMGLRLGDDPRLCLTTTPRAGAALAALLKEPGLAVTRGSALDNAQFLAPGFVEGLRALYAGTRLERQEIDGEVIEALSGAVFHSRDVERARTLGRDGWPGRFQRLVVAVDPPAGIGGSACGVVVAGLMPPEHLGPRAWVLADRTVHGLTVGGWAARVATAVDWAMKLGVVTVVAEANQGGEMVRQVLLQAGVKAPIQLVHARMGKAARAEPVSLLYEQGRVAHAPGLEALEDQMLLLGADDRNEASPDRADALVWALTALVVQPGGGPPSIRWL